ncbi:MAG: PD-(D/E)XK nuclease family protein, partial [Bacteroidales bacterium]|nr:PD-(D/E)XK nuclease family protein [Bacteroidales bacterium]
DEYEDVQQYAPKGCVSFMTIHQSKGLEFPVVLVGSLENTPRKQHDDLDEILQAQYFHKKPFEPFEQMKFFDFYRLYYTAFSRAQHVLALSCGEVDTGKRRAPSKYLKPVYTGLPKWRDGVFDISKLDLNDVHGSALKQEYSFTSHILLFENCAQQYRFFKELAFAPVRKGAMLFGTLVHQTIEDIHKRALRGEFDAIQPDSIEQWFWVNYHSLAKRERTYLDAPQLHRALEHVLRYAEREHVRWGSLKEAEFDVALVKDRYVLRGTVDLIRGDDGTVEIIDFKSEKKPDLVVEREKVEQYRRQLEVYAHIVEERTGANVSKMHIYYTSERDGNPYVSFVKRRASIENTIDTFGAVVSRIEAGDFRISERPIKLCESCDMRYYCDGKY